MSEQINDWERGVLEKLAYSAIQEQRRIGMPDQTFHQFIVTRPRFIPCITLDTVPCPAS